MTCCDVRFARQESKRKPTDEINGCSEGGHGVRMLGIG